MLATDPHLRATVVESGDLERRRSLGQFFTPHDVAEFIWDMAELLRGQNWDPTAHVIDPACGEGVFLRVAIERGHDPKHCWGVDIDDTLAPLWQADRYLNGLRLFRTNGLLDDPDIGLVTGSFDLVIGNPPFSGRGLKDLLQLVHPRNGKAAARARSLFGDDADKSAAAGVEGSTSLTADERQSLDQLVRHLSRYVCWRLREESDDAIEAARDDVTSGGLFADLEPGLVERVSELEQMAQDIAACPADRILDTRRPAVRNAIRRMAGTAIEVFFTERFVQLAKPGGMIAVIVPESILASDQLAPQRRWLMREIQLLAVVGLPQKVFTGVGAKAKTGIIFARRFTTDEQEENAKARATGGYADRLGDSRILLTAPNVESTQWSLAEYLSSVIVSAKECAVADAEKETSRGR